ncbi:hypothetical protein [Photobacterium leiognathi]|nr:hypothetical protein [Photobacterium leiognathi]
MKNIISFIFMFISSINISFADNINKRVKMHAYEGYHRESCFHAKENDKLHVLFHSPHQIGFGIHWHTGGVYNTKTHNLVDYQEHHDSQEQSYFVTIPEDSTYCFDFTNLNEIKTVSSFYIQLSYTLNKPDK